MSLSPTDIKIALLKRGEKERRVITLAGLAREWGTYPEVLSRIVNRREPFVYQEYREKLAKYLGVPVSAIGREPSPDKARETAEAM